MEKYIPPTGGAISLYDNNRVSIISIFELSTKHLTSLHVYVDVDVLKVNTKSSTDFTE